MNARVDALLELLTEPSDSSGLRIEYLIGQVAAEVIAGHPSGRDLAKVAAKAQIMAYDGSTENGARRELLAMVAGMFNALKAQWSSNENYSQTSVKERLLFSLAEETAGPTELSVRAGCAIAVTSRNLRALREQGLVRIVDVGAHIDGRRRLHELTKQGHEVVAAQIEGRDDGLIAEPVSNREEAVDSELLRLVDVMRRTGRHDPKTAAELAPSVERLQSRATDSRIRAEALGELCVIARSVRDCYDGTDLEHWYEELFDIAGDDAGIEARAHYERGRWQMIYGDPESGPKSAVEDFERAMVVAEGIADSDEKRMRLGWCEYQLATIDLHGDDPATAGRRASAAKEHFAVVVDDERWCSQQDEISATILAARAHDALGGDDAKRARRMLEDVIPLAEEHRFYRQLADARFHLGRMEAGNDQGEAMLRLASASRDYAAVGKGDLSVVASVAEEVVRYASKNPADVHTDALRLVLRRFSDDLVGADRGSYPLALYWRVATISKTAAELARAQGLEEEAEVEYRRAFDWYEKAKDAKGQADVIAAVWHLRQFGGTATSDRLRSLTAELGWYKVSDEVLDSSSKSLSQNVSENSTSVDLLSIGGPLMNL